MSVAYTYHRYLVDRENYKCYVFRCNGPSHVELSRAAGTLWEMGNTDANKDEGQKSGKKAHSNKLVDELEKVKKKKCTKYWYKALGVVLSVAVVLAGLAEIGWAITSSVLTKVFSNDSGRVVAYIVLAVTAAVALSVAIYSAVGLFKKKKKSLKFAGFVLVLLAVVQAIIAGVSVKFTVKDEYTLAESLRESFNLAARGDPAAVRKWAHASHDLECCGLFGPEDYRHPNSNPLFPPDVPIYCCPNYNETQSGLVQEVARQICKSTRSYYKVGCGGLIKNTLEKAANVVLTITIILLVLEVLLSVHDHITYKLDKKHKLRDLEAEDKSGEGGEKKPEHA